MSKSARQGVAKLVEDLPTFDATVTSDPAVKVLEVYAYREMLLRQQFNERARQVMLAYATGTNLEQLGALLNVEKLPGEQDEAYRARIQLAPAAFSVAGPATAYRYYALSAASTVADASVTSPRPDDIRAAVLGLLADHGAEAGLVAAMTALLDGAVWPGTVLVSLLSAQGDGSASDDEIEAVELAIAADEDVRPVTDWPQVRSARSSITRSISTWCCFPGRTRQSCSKRPRPGWRPTKPPRAGWGARSPAPGSMPPAWWRACRTR
jgi:phage-related baseplate assembly protein